MSGPLAIHTRTAAEGWAVPAPTGPLPAPIPDPGTLLLTVCDGQTCRARCQLWPTTSLLWQTGSVGLIGQYAADDPDAAVALLQHACATLRQHDCRWAIGPMDGSTWRRYRLVTWRGHEPPFFLEPDTPDAWLQQFESAGFSAIAHYSSALNLDLSVRDPRVPDAWLRLQQQGVNLRPLDPQRFDDELRAIHRLSLQAFAENLLYTPIDAAAFLAMYRPIQPHLDPRLVLLAEVQSELVGFLFAIPDLGQAQRGTRIDTVIIKSMAVAPGRRHAGLGSVLMDRCHAIAAELGYRRAIHALMHESNASRRLSDHTAQTMRRYALMARSLP